MILHKGSCQAMQILLTNWVHQRWLERGTVSCLLLPLAKVVGLMLLWRRRYYEKFYRHRFSAKIPVVIVGNLYAGGTGKTPAVLGLTQALEAAGWQVGIVSRGYGVQLGSAPLVGHGALPAKLYGDEPALIAQSTHAALAVHPKRERAATALLRQYPGLDIILCDDGLQHLALARDVEIIVQDARGLGNGWVQPAGPLRETAKRLTFAYAIIDNIGVTTLTVGAEHIPSKNSQPLQVKMSQRITGLRHLASGKIENLADFLAKYSVSNLCALAAIGQPEQFFTSLRKSGFQLSRTIALPDHTVLSADLMTEIAERFILITAKDSVKYNLQPDPRIWVVEVQTIFHEPHFITEFLKYLKQIKQSKSVTCD